MWDLDRDLLYSRFSKSVVCCSGSDYQMCTLEVSLGTHIQLYGLKLFSLNSTYFLSSYLPSFPDF